MASNDNNNKHKLEEAESSMTRRRLSPRWTTDDDYSDSLEEEIEEAEEETKKVVSSEEMPMNQFDTSKEKLQAKRAHGIIFGDDGDTTLPSSEPRTPESRWHSDEDSNDDDFWM
jgi:hypothetical protein